MPALLAQKCATAGCHSSTAPADGLDLSSPNVGARLVGVAAKSGGLLVDPSAPTQSVMFQRIQPTAAGRMPVSGDPLDDATIACFRTWISGLGQPAPTPSASPTPTPTPSPTATPTPTPDAGPSRPTLRVAAGATTSYTDKSGAVWAADTGFSAGKSDETSPPAAVSSTDDPTLYSGQRWGQDPVSLMGVPFSYSFDVPNGSYQVTLKFAELFTGITSAGGRLFNVAINGQAVLTNFDIFAEAGGRNVAIDRKFTAAVTNGKIQIDFTNTNANFAKVDAILIAPE
jgi:hypothetical protein